MMFYLQPSKMPVFMNYISSIGALFRSFLLQNLFFKMYSLELTSRLPSYQGSCRRFLARKSRECLLDLIIPHYLKAVHFFFISESVHIMHALQVLFQMPNTT